MSDLDAIWRRYAAQAGVLQRRPSFRLDPDWLADRHPKLPLSPDSPDACFSRTMAAEVPNLSAIIADLITLPDLAELIARGTPDAVLLGSELIRLGAPIDALVSDFSHEAYLVGSPDVADAGIDPFLHYLKFGARENRRILRNIRDAQIAGRKSYYPHRPTVMILVHEMSRSGAPSVGVDLAREASSTHNVIVVALRGGELLNNFLAHACNVVISDRLLSEYQFLDGEIFGAVEFAIANSVECEPFLPFLIAHEIPVAHYLHEYTDYTLPPYKALTTALLTDLLVFSSEHVRDNWSGVFKDVNFDIDRDGMLLAQRNFVVGEPGAEALADARRRLSAKVGRDLTNVRLICGAGHVQWRKGTDIFVMIAQAMKRRDPDTVFLWIGDGLNHEDIHFGVWMDYHLHQIQVNDPQGNLFYLPTGPEYPDVLTAADAMFMSSRLDPLPNVVFEALEQGCRIVQFDQASGFSDAKYRRSPMFTTVPYADADAALAALQTIPRKIGGDNLTSSPPRPPLFAPIARALRDRLSSQHYYLRGATEFDVPVRFGPGARDAANRVREREKILTYGRHYVWRDLAEVRDTLAESDLPAHRQFSLADWAPAGDGPTPHFNLHVHAFYIEDVAAHAAWHQARRLVVTTDTENKADRIRSILTAEGLTPEVEVLPNKGRDILPFLKVIDADRTADPDEIWCHVHQKKSLGSAATGDAWRRFLLGVLLGDEQRISNAIELIATPGVGLVAPLDPYRLSWNSSRRWLTRLADRLPRNLPDHPMLFPIGNMFWVRRGVVQAMMDIFGPNYPWPNEPIGNDGTEFHLIERLWPYVAADQGLKSVFVHKADERRA